MTKPTARVLALLELLQSGGTRNVRELAGRLDVDERAVRRYVDHLIDLDVPVQAVRGRYGGYRLAAGYRMPPLMLTDDEALAVLLGLVAGRRSGVLAPAGTATETATAKIRRVLPARLADRLDALLGTLVFTSTPADVPAPETAVLLTVADAVHHHRPVAVRYVAGDGRRSERVLHPYGLVSHSGRWYVTGHDPAVDDERTLRLDRMADVRTLAGSFVAPEHVDPSARVLDSLATAPYRHEVVLRVQATPEQLRTRLPAGIAVVRAPDHSEGDSGGNQPWLRVELRVESLDWLPGVLAALDRPFAIEQPEALRDLVRDLAGRLAASAARDPEGLTDRR